MLAMICMGLTYGGTALASSKPPVIKNSEVMEDPDTVWRESGFRIGLAYEFNALLSLGYAANILTQGFSVRPYYRFKDNWAVGANLAYGVPILNQTGLRWSLTLEGTWWIQDKLSVSLGAGYAGRMVRCNFSDPNCQRIINYGEGFSSIQEDMWLGEGDQLDTCDGGGPTLNTRLQYQWVVTEYFGTGPYLQAYFESIRCEEEIGGVHPSTGRNLLYFDRWSYVGASAGWWFTWR